MLSTILAIALTSQCSGGSCPTPSGFGFRLGFRSQVQATPPMYQQAPYSGGCPGGVCPVPPVPATPTTMTPRKVYGWYDGTDSDGRTRCVWGWTQPDGRVAFHESEQPAIPPVQGVAKHDIAKERKTTGLVTSAVETR